LEPKERKCQEAGKDCIMGRFVTCVVIKSRILRGMWHVALKGEVRNACKI
jgi:hypothetical protein